MIIMDGYITALLAVTGRRPQAAPASTWPRPPSAATSSPPPPASKDTGWSWPAPAHRARARLPQLAGRHPIAGRRQDRPGRAGRRPRPAGLRTAQPPWATSPA